MLSRFVPDDKQKEIIRKIEDGTVNIVIATHRILSSDVKFWDLGLLVLDEEQKFGVEQKEKIKVMKNNVNVLSLSATPVPRTLHMSLSGIRDISTLETPPENRLPIETYVVEYTDALLVDAVKREIGRGGQVFILFNRVQGIEKFYKDVQDMLEGVSITYAHGKMTPSTLEKRISDFYDGKYQVLISTTIIENGIDLPNANTLIVIDSDRLGLAELYQLRGRVGRSHNLAYAYFTVREGKVLTEEAVKRLDALMRYTELGSGFKIAMEDLEIRGAGNILGKEQHGNMQKVGYDMYCRLLNESVKELQGEKVEATLQAELKIDGDIFLPTDYITSSNRRVEFYKRISQISSLEEEQELIKHYEDTDGALPKPALRLLKMGLLKKLAQEIGVRQVVVTNYGMGLHFWDNTLFGKPDVFKALDKYIKEAVLSPSDPPMIVFNKSNRSQDEKIELMRSFLLVAAGHDTADK
jgi:transcription-repair coupling factor (superfamily II helicase)